MLKETIGAASTFLVLLPFLFINTSIVKIQKNSLRRFMFFLVNVIQILIIVFLAYLLYFVGETTLYGLAVVVSIFLFLELIIWLVKRKKYAKNNSDEDYSSDLFEETQKLDRDEIKEEYNSENEEIEEIENNDEDYDLENTKQPLVVEKEEEIILQESSHTEEAEENLIKVDTNKEVVKTLDDIFRKS